MNDSKLVKWEKYSGIGRKTTLYNIISVTPLGFMIASNLYDMIGKPKLIDIYYNDYIIGIVKTDDKISGYKVASRHRSIFISCKRMVASLKITPKHYNAVIKDDMIIFTYTGEKQ